MDGQGKQYRDRDLTNAVPDPAADLLEEVVAETKARSIYDHPAEMFPEIEKLGTWLTASGMFGVRNKEQGYVVAMTCFAERITPLEFRRRYHIIEGSPSKRADRMHADFLARGGRVNWVEYTAERCEALFLHPELAPKGVSITVTLKEMVERKVTLGKNGMKENWGRWPRQMLKARVLSEGIRQVDPGCVAGEYTPEEIADFEEAPAASTDDSAAPGAQSKPDPVQSEGSTPADAPGAAESDLEVGRREREAEGQERVERVVKAFAVYTIKEDDLERLAGDFETGEVVESKDWQQEHFDRFQKVHDAIKSAAASARTGTICRLFNLPTSAMEG